MSPVGICKIGPPTYKLLAILAPPSIFKTPPLVKLVASSVVRIDNVLLKKVNVLNPVIFPWVVATMTCPCVKLPLTLPTVNSSKRLST